jgi:integrase/recombinase XerD
MRIRTFPSSLSRLARSVSVASSRLVAAARAGGQVEGISGPDRAMLYTLAAWTGFRKGELGSLTLGSLDLKSNPPTGTVAACYSKRKREDTQVLHVELTKQLKAWLRQRKPKPGEPLFPISGRVPGGTDRKTHKMMQRDLEAARKAWIEETKSKREKQRRAKTDFLAYRNQAGLYADFHSCRHLFITNLERAGVRPKVAQTLARHSDIRLTLDVYTHSEQEDKAVAIAALPGPPGV